MADAAKHPWSAQEDLDLLTSIEKGLSIGEIASQLGRAVPECRVRLEEITRSADPIFPRETAAS